MNPIDGKMRYLVIKKETTPGTAADMSSGTIAIAISDVSFQDQLQKIEDKFAVSATYLTKFKNEKLNSEEKQGAIRRKIYNRLKDKQKMQGLLLEMMKELI